MDSSYPPGIRGDTDEKGHKWVFKGPGSIFSLPEWLMDLFNF